MVKFALVIATGVGVFASAGDAVAAAKADSRPNFAPNPAVSWLVRAPGPYISPPSGPGPIVPLNPEQQPFNPANQGPVEPPHFPMGNPNNPILQPWARDRVQLRNTVIVAGQPGFDRHASCWPLGTPGFLLYPAQPIFFVQAPKEVLMIWQGDHQVRHVYLNTPHSPNPKPSWYGESVGHYEGDTLVVDTIALSAKTLVDEYGTPHSDQLHTVERFHMTKDGSQLLVDLHVEDPEAFTTPWNAMQRYSRVEPGVAEPVRQADDFLTAIGSAGPMTEVSCAENPQALFYAKGTMPIPQSDKPDF